MDVMHAITHMPASSGRSLSARAYATMGQSVSLCVAYRVDQRHRLKLRHRGQHGKQSCSKVLRQRSEVIRVLVRT